MAGLALKTRVFAAVKATNLDKRYPLTSRFSLNICWFSDMIHIRSRKEPLHQSRRSRDDIFRQSRHHSHHHFYRFSPSFAYIHTPLCYYCTWRRQSVTEKDLICAFPCAVRSLSFIPSHNFVPLQVEHLDGLLLHNPLRES